MNIKYYLIFALYEKDNHEVFVAQGKWHGDHLPSKVEAEEFMKTICWSKLKGIIGIIQISKENNGWEEQKMKKVMIKIMRICFNIVGLGIVVISSILLLLFLTPVVFLRIVLPKNSKAKAVKDEHIQN